MNYSTIHTVVFSPTHTSAKIAHAIESTIACEQRIKTDLTLDESLEPIIIQDQLTIIAVPVYAGRVAPLAIKRLRKVKGINSPAILVVLYGNREYEDALVELYDVAKEAGFTPLSAAAFIGEHSYSTDEMPIAKSRPNSTDLQKAEQFGKDSFVKLQEANLTDFFVKGNRPYKQVGTPTPAAPHKTDECTECGECMLVCPTGAIKKDDDGVITTDIMNCIKCCACVRACPIQARYFFTPYTAMLHKNCAEPKEPELFF